ncbi:MAG TPA: SRPBCC family protein [Roseiflexaceae bacterium]|nr:SRPBCC family protein [Roseiflexaceae bacterium]
MGESESYEAGRRGGRAVSVRRARFIAASVEAVFAALADPARLAGVLPRVRKVELLERGASRARIATHMELTPLHTLCAEGEVRWEGMRAIVFRTARPVAVETRLELRPATGGTDLSATLTIDLASLLGPLAALVPREQVAAAIAPDVEATLAAIARAVETG